ncbi:MAG TPA: iron ABC transporter permease, partial [Casimicrobiaceae bacterium]|nr:iron ABC transporter permease [Casimicrobiaceae bacterium]
MSPAKKAILFWIAVGAAGFVLLPWYALQDSIASIGWLKDYTGKDNAPALLQALKHGRIWLLPIVGFFIAAAALLQLPISRLARANGLLIIGALGFVFFLAQGFAIGAQGWSFELLTTTFAPLAAGQYGMGWGAALSGASLTMLFALGLAERGYFNGDAFIAASVVGIAVSVAVFTFYPVIRILLSAIQDQGGALSAQAFFARMFTEKIWGVACLAGAGRCGVAWNTLVLALLCAAGCTSLGLAFALIVSRTGFRYKRLL